ncbi:MAG: hypothetical protein ABI401_10480 [Candidatus Dormibacter sp.]
MAAQQDHSDQVQEASIKVPGDWLMALLDEDAVRQAQRPDTIVTLSAAGLSLSGVELVVERRWVREPFWHQISEAVTRGFIHKSSAVQVTLRGDRREHQRQPPPRPAH